MGLGTFAFINAISQKDGLAESEEELALNGQTAFSLSIGGAALQLIYLIAMCFTQVTTYGGTYFDPTAPTKDITAVAATSPFAGDALIWTLVTIIALAGAVACAYLGKTKGNWKTFGLAIAICGFVAAICLRVVFYCMGISVYPFY